ncbi:MAG: VCBS repeat-containing protein [candidate division Zixibacteria bacterium]|nr:VCBS repeat-containing protein [candidate division Zixibacteria bacterium]
MKALCIITTTIIVLAMGGVAWSDPDPGLPDTVRIEGGPLVVGQSRPLTMTIVNDESLFGYCLGFLTTSIDINNGFARYDSIVYVNRMADPAVLSWRFATARDNDGVSPDSLLLAAEPGLGNNLAPGNTAVMEVYFTGLTPGVMKMDSVYLPPGCPFSLGYAIPSCPSFTPLFEAYQVTIVEQALPPELALPASPIRMVAGDDVSLPVSAESPEGLPTTLELETMVDYDDDSVVPQSEPIFGAGNPGQFEWTPSAEDIGIWQVTFEACDSAGVCATGSVVIQVVSDSPYLITFNTLATPGSGEAVGMLHGNFDGDPEEEVFVGSTGANDGTTAELYENGGQGYLDRTYLLQDGRPKQAPLPGYFNEDAYLDVVARSFYTDSRIMVMAGNGDNSFIVTGESNDGSPVRGTAAGEFTGDNYLDMAAVWFDGIHIFAGNGQAGFTSATFIATDDSALSINSADFNDDGFDDLAVGTVEGINIYLSDGDGTFALTHFYSQLYGSTDIEITNKGSDFNNDDIFDLCISTPSVGGQYSQMVVYLGNGDGSFVQEIVHTVKGQIFGNCVGDFNNDGNLDIGYVNGAKKYMAIFFGDGDGAFTNELRWDIPAITPVISDCFDVDLDGDLDLLVAANGIVHPGPPNSLFTLVNQSNPPGFEKRALDISACNNASMELVSASGKVFNHVRNTMSSGDYFHRNLDQNSVIDDYAALGVVESGPYTLTVRPKSDRPAGEPFTLEFTRDGRLFRLAKDVPMNATGYDFNLFLGTASAVAPMPGVFVEVNPPSFAWIGEGEYDFQLATDIDFANVAVDDVVSGNSLTLSSPLLSSGADRYRRLLLADKTAWRWRVCLPLCDKSGSRLRTDLR